MADDKKATNKRKTIVHSEPPIVTSKDITQSPVSLSCFKPNNDPPLVLFNIRNSRLIFLNQASQSNLTYLFIKYENYFSKKKLNMKIKGEKLRKCHMLPMSRVVQ